MPHDPGAQGSRVADRGHRRPGIDDINRLDADAFVARFGTVFEDSPWVAERAHAAAPFRDADALHAAMVAVVAAAPRDARLALIRAHPDLAGKAAIAGALGPESTREQAAAGLDALTPTQHGTLTARTAAYRARHGFPFVLCAREHDAESIIATAGARLGAATDDEERTALDEIAKIARLRLADLVAR